MKNLTGSEKQIKWADEIRNKLILTIKNEYRRGIYDDLDQASKSKFKNEIDFVGKQSYYNHGNSELTKRTGYVDNQILLDRVLEISESKTFINHEQREIDLFQQIIVSKAKVLLTQIQTINPDKLTDEFDREDIDFHSEYLKFIIRYLTTGEGLKYGEDFDESCSLGAPAQFVIKMKKRGFIDGK